MYMHRVLSLQTSYDDHLVVLSYDVLCRETAYTIPFTYSDLGDKSNICTMMLRIVI